MDITALEVLVLAAIQKAEGLPGDPSLMARYMAVDAVKKAFRTVRESGEQKVTKGHPASCQK